MSNKKIPAQPERATILIVDDEPINLSAVSYILRDDYRVLAAKSGSMALEVLKSSQMVDLILLDINMPGMNGFETIKEIRGNPLTSTIPVIFITTLDSEITEVFALKTGAVDYIHKPIKPEIVKLRIKTHLELKKSRDLLKNHNIWLEDEVKRQVEEKTVLLEISLTTIIGLAETRDTDTGNHIIRTKEYVRTLAMNLRSVDSDNQMTEEDIATMSKASQLHDIGKIGIPDSILLKPGPLTPQEFETMKNHSRIGGASIEKAIQRALKASKRTREYGSSDTFKLLEFARTIAFSHHEKWDGSGYPDGLRGKAIPLPARIMAIADVFDALTSKRIYKESMPIEQAFDIICDGSGSHFDPVLVEVLNKSREEFCQISINYIDY